MQSHAAGESNCSYVTQDTGGIEGDWLAQRSPDVGNVRLVTGPHRATQNRYCRTLCGEDQSAAEHLSVWLLNSVYTVLLTLCVSLRGTQPLYLIDCAHPWVQLLFFSILGSADQAPSKASRLRASTCFAPRLDEDCLLCFCLLRSSCRRFATLLPRPKGVAD